MDRLISDTKDLSGTNCVGKATKDYLTESKEGVSLFGTPSI